MMAETQTAEYAAETVREPDRITPETKVKLVDKWRPKTWSEVVGQAKVLRQIECIRKTEGLGGQAYWVSGQSGQGKTTIARLLAAEIADQWGTDEINGTDLTLELCREIAKSMHLTRIGGNGKTGRAWIVNEAHGMTKGVVRELLTMLEPSKGLPANFMLVFTTTKDGNALFEDANLDAHPLTSRCKVLTLTSQGLARPFAELVKRVAQAEGLDGQPIEKYVRLLQDCKNNLREALQCVAMGEMMGEAQP